MWEKKPMGRLSWRRCLAVGATLSLFKLALLLGVLLWLKHSGIATPDICQWDCRFYREIVQEGYRADPQHIRTTAFYPAFPLAVSTLKTLSAGALSFESAALVLNFSCFALAAALLMAWASEVGLRRAWLVPLLWALDRNTLWVQIPYTEALFAFFLHWFLLWGRTKPEGPRKWLMLSAIGGAASAGRVLGGLFVGALGLDRLKIFLRKPWWGVLCLALGASGAALFLLHLHDVTGDPFYGFKAQRVWGRFVSFASAPPNLWWLYKQAYLPTILVLTGAIIWIVRAPLKLSNTERWLFFFLMLIPLASTNRVSLTRYMSMITLGHMAWAYQLERPGAKLWEKRVLWALTIALLAGELYWQTKLLAMFIRGDGFLWAG